MGIKQQLTDPWAFLAGGLTGGLIGAVTAAVANFPAGAAVAVGVGGIVYGAKVALGVLADRRTDDVPALPTPAKGSPAEVWLRRSEKAVRTLRQQIGSSDPTTRGQVGDVDDAAAETLADLRRLASQVASVSDAASRIDIARLRAERGRLDTVAQSSADPDLKAEQSRTATSVDAQIAVYDRLVVAHDMLVARMQSATIDLEGLIAQVAEVLALSATAGGVDTMRMRVTDISDQLAGLQSGLRETEELSRRALAPGAP